MCHIRYMIYHTLWSVGYLLPAKLYIFFRKFGSGLDKNSGSYSVSNSIPETDFGSGFGKGSGSAYKIDSRAQ